MLTALLPAFVAALIFALILWILGARIGGMPYRVLCAIFLIIIVILVLRGLGIGHGIV